MKYTRHVSNLTLKSRKFKESSPEEKQLKKIKTKRKYIIYMHKKTPFYLLITNGYENGYGARVGYKSGFLVRVQKNSKNSVK